MPRSTRTVRVTEVPGEPMRYTVESWSSDKPHLVDLAEHGGRGQCSCKSWQCRNGPVVKAGCKVGDPRSLCRHVVAARTAFTNTTLAGISAALNKTPVAAHE